MRTICAELGHAGGQSVIPTVVPIAPSVVPNAIFAREPVEMSEADIARVIAAFGAAARRAVAAGFDGIHIHSGNGYLLSSSTRRTRIAAPIGGAAMRRGAAVSSSRSTRRFAPRSARRRRSRRGSASQTPSSMG
jgi:NADH:flavin oxidoreductase / NADH oxidase family